MSPQPNPTAASRHYIGWERSVSKARIKAEARWIDFVLAVRTGMKLPLLLAARNLAQFLEQQ
jgi:hypothetical protein